VWRRSGGAVSVAVAAASSEADAVSTYQEAHSVPTSDSLVETSPDRSGRARVLERLPRGGRGRRGWDGREGEVGRTTGLIGEAWVRNTCTVGATGPFAKANML
jgi:hypothetical protein